MKKIRLLLSLSFVLGMISSLSLNTAREEGKRNNATSNTNNVVLNLTSVGLYNNTAGTKDEMTYVEYAKVLTLNVGDVLPKNEITCSSPNMKFVTWCYTLPNVGLPTYTDKVVKDVNIYQAVFEPTINLIENEIVDPTPTPTPTPTPDDDNIIRYYFTDKPWWNKDEAASYIYAFNSSGEKNASWPGEKMTKLSDTKDANGCYTWYYDVDFSKYTKAVIARVNPDSSDTTNLYWGAKTKDITLDREKNTITLKSSTAVWGDPGCDFSLSVVEYN